MQCNTTWLIWIGGIIGLLAIGFVRLAGKSFGVAGLAAGMIVIGTCAVVFLLKAVVPRLERRDGDNAPSASGEDKEKTNGTSD